MLNIIPPAKHKGTDEALALLDLVKNNELYSNRVNQLEALRQAATDEIAKLTKAKDLDKALQKAKENLEKSESIVKDAQQKAEDILSQANAEANNITLKASFDRDKILEGLSEKQAQIERQAIESTDSLRVINEAKLEAENDLKAAQQAKEEALALKSQFQGKLKDLQDRLKDL